MKLQHSSLPTPLFLAASLALAGPARGDGLTAGEIGNWFQPDRVQQATLSPDGRHLAYTVHEDEKTSIVLTNVSELSEECTIPIGEDAVIPDSHDTEKTPIRVPFLRWSESGRLVFSAERPAAGASDARRNTGPAIETAVYAVDADGGNLLKLADEDDFALVDSAVGEMGVITLPRKPRVVGLTDDEPDSVLIAAVGPALNSDSHDPNHYGRLAAGLFKINVRTGRRQSMDDRDITGRLLYDRQGHPRVEARRPVDQRTESFVSLAPPAGQARGKDLQKLLGDDISPENYLGSRTFPVGFDHDPNILYVASNVGRDTYGLFALDLRAGKRTALPVEQPAFDLADFERPFSDSGLVFDRGRHRLVGVQVTGLEATTQWLDPELTGIQSTLNDKFAGRNVQLIDWDDRRVRFLALVSGGADPGRYYVFDRADNRLVPFVRRAPAMDTDETNAVASFAFDTAEGVHLTGYLTLPRTPRANPPPLLVCLHDGPWQRDEPGFNREAQVLAAMGFVVARVNYRGSAGFGTRFREAIRQDLDRIPVADLRATVAWVAAHYKVDDKRVALIGEGFGGYVALRALQLYPDDFRCAVAIDAPTDLELWCRKPESRQEAIGRQQQAINAMHEAIPGMTGQPDFANHYTPKAKADDFQPPPDLDSNPPEAPATARRPSGAAFADFPVTPVNFANEFRRWYFGGDPARLAAISPARRPELITKPVLLIQDPLDADGESGKSPALRAALSHTSNPADYLETTSAFTRRQPGACGEVYSRIEEFLNLNLYEFNVKVGVPKVQK